MAEHPEQASYRECIGEDFLVAVNGDDTMSFTLAELTSAGPLTTKDAERAGLPAPFSILFHGPAEPILQQAMYRLSHPALGDVELFLVPVGPDGEKMGYEAVFN